MNELHEIAKDLEPGTLRQKILQKGARLIGLQQLTAINSFQRDQQRLNRRNRAVYEKLGMGGKEDEETVQNFLGDVTIAGEKPKAGIPGWAAALIAAGAAGAGLAGSQLIPEKEPPAVVDDEPVPGYGLRIR